MKETFVFNQENLRTFAEAYGVAVRAGLLTPNIEDEKAARKLFGLPDVSQPVISEWERTNGVRAPITLSGGTSQNDQAAGLQEPPK